MEGDKIYKINYISLNNINTQFCFSFNDGIKSYNIDDFSERYSVNKLGNISYCVLLRELDTVVFVGKENNEIYDNKKIVVYDLSSKKEISSTSFSNEIHDIRMINKFLLVTIKSVIKIFSLENLHNLISVKEIALPENEIYEIWENPPKEENPELIIQLMYPFKNEISIIYFFGDEWILNKKKDINNTYGKIQGLFYIKQLGLVFAVDEIGKYIYGIDPNEGQQKMCIYRGSVPGVITSISLINKNYLLLNNINRTIYIINLKPSGISFGGLLGKYGFGIDTSIFMTIKYNEITNNIDGDFFQKDFLEKGAILLGDGESSEFSIFAYNGYIYKIKINFVKAKYDVTIKKKFADYQISTNYVEELIESDKDPNYKSIFDKSDKKENDDNFINL